MQGVEGATVAVQEAAKVGDLGDGHPLISRDTGVEGATIFFFLEKRKTAMINVKYRQSKHPQHPRNALGSFGGPFPQTPSSSR